MRGGGAWRTEREEMAQASALRNHHLHIAEQQFRGSFDEYGECLEQEVLKGKVLKDERRV